MYAQFSQRTDLNISLNANKELNRQSDQLLQIYSKTFFIFTIILFLDFQSLKFNCIFRILQVDSFILITAINQMQSNCHIPYILVGAGISSLQAALILAEHRKDFIILEASNRIGGRICSLPLRQALAGDLRNQKEWLKEAENDPIECGGTWICEDNHIMLQYVNKYKLTKTEQFYTGKHVLAEDYQKYRQCGSLGEYYEQYKDKIMKLFASMEKIQERVTQLSNKKEQKNITLEEQVELRNIYKEYDNMSAYEFILKEVEDEFLAKLLNKQASTLQCCESKDYSLFSLIQGQPLANVKFYVGAQAANIDGYRLKEGMSSIYQNIKADIQQIFDAQGQGKQIDQLIKLQSPVLQIKNAKVPVEVITKNQRYTCDKVVMGVPLGTLGKINIQELSAGKRLIANNQVTCNMTRMAMIFKQPFWRKQFAGYVSFSHNFPMNQIVDLTPHQQKYGILAFVFNSNGFQEWSKSITADCDHKQGPQHQREWYQINQIKALQIVANIYLNGDINSPHLKDVPIFAKSMSQYEYIKSTYQSTTALAVADKVYQAGDDINKCFTRDQLNIIILGSDFSDEFAGYMEGAIRIARKKMYAECQSKDPLEYLTAVKGFQSTSGEPKL